MNKQATKKVKKLHDRILLDENDRALFIRPKKFRDENDRALFIRPKKFRASGHPATDHFRPVNPLKEMKRIFTRNGGGTKGLQAAKNWALGILDEKLVQACRNRRVMAQTDLELPGKAL